MTTRRDGGLTEAKCLRPRPKLRGRGRGQNFGLITGGPMHKTANCGTTSSSRKGTSDERVMVQLADELTSD